MVAVVPSAQADKIYRWVDPQGNIIYQDQPPPKGAGSIEVKEIDPAATTTQFERPNMTQSGKSAAEEGVATASSAKRDQRAWHARRRAVAGGQTNEPLDLTPVGPGVGPLLPTPSAGLPAVPVPGALAAPPPPPPPPAPGAF